MELYRWVKCKDKEPDSGAAFRVPFFYKGEQRDWMYFNGAVNEYDQVYDVDSAIPDVDQALVEWLEKVEADQQELWEEVMKIIFPVRPIRGLMISNKFTRWLRCFLFIHKDGYYPDSYTRHCIRCMKKF